MITKTFQAGYSTALKKLCVMERSNRPFKWGKKKRRDKKIFKCENPSWWIIYLYVARKIIYIYEESINTLRNIVMVVTGFVEAKDFFSCCGATSPTNSQLYDMGFREVLRRIVTSPNLTTPVIYVNDDRRGAIRH